jgi:simple sugar transport system permease protein
MKIHWHHWRKPAEAIALPIGSLLFALVLFGIFCALVGANPLAVYVTIFRAAFGNWRVFQATLISAAPLMLTALCTALPARLGLMIIGNEGALVMGGIGATIAGLAIAPTAPPIVIQLAMAIAGIIWGGIWIAIAGVLRHYRAVNETISSLLLTYIAIALLNHLVEGPMRDPTSLNKPASYPIPDAAQLGQLPFTRIHFGLLYGLVACAIAHVLIQHTTFGFATRTTGGNPKAAQLVGLPIGKLTITICFLAGSCAGLAGMVEVAAVHGRASEAIAANYGYAGILVAFVARQNAIACTLVAILLGGIITSGGALQRNLGLPEATVMVFQGFVFLVVLFSESLYGQLAVFKQPEETHS